MSGNLARSPASSPGSASGLSHTPTSPRAQSAARRSRHNASGTMTGTPSGMSASAFASRSRVQASSVTVRSLMSFGIDTLLEGLDPEPAHRIDETLVLVAALDVNIDQALDDPGHFGGGERRADHLAQRRVFALIAADRNLVPLLAVLVDAEHANV